MTASEQARDVGVFVHEALAREEPLKDVLISCLRAVAAVDGLSQDKRLQVEQVLSDLVPTDNFLGSDLEVKKGLDTYLLTSDSHLFVPGVIEGIPLSELQYTILYVLMRNPGKAYSKQMFELKGTALQTNVCRLNKKLKKYGTRILNIPRQGYYFGDNKSTVRVIDAVDTI
ncbi:MAG: helix-turn-helix domain-containing protein [bacterium]|nr:helix-turn-helix domain-containing protein [bacterium]